METSATTVYAGADKVKLEFAYDLQGRRFKKEYHAWDPGSSQYILATTAFYLYDGWNLLAELTFDDTPVGSTRH